MWQVSTGNIGAEYEIKRNSCALGPLGHCPVKLSNLDAALYPLTADLLFEALH